MIPLLAATDPSVANDVLISFKTGAIAEMVTTTLRIARLYFVFALLIGYLVEWTGKSPDAPRDYAGCTWRSFIVLFLLAFYTQVFGSLVNLSIPAVSDVGTKWFSEFLSFCAWPIISGLLLRITVALGSHLIFGTGAGVIETLASSLLMTASAIATPVLCSKLVGGSVKSAASHGVDAARNFASSSFDYGKRGLTLAKSLTGKGGAAEGAASVVRGGSSSTSSAPSNSPGD